MDPALWELLRAEAGTDGDRVLEAIIRLARPGIEIPDVRIVSRFGTDSDLPDPRAGRHRGAGTARRDQRQGSARTQSRVRAGRRPPDLATPALPSHVPDRRPAQPGARADRRGRGGGVGRLGRGRGLGRVPVARRPGGSRRGHGQAVRGSCRSGISGTRRPGRARTPTGTGPSTTGRRSTARCEARGLTNSWDTTPRSRIAAVAARTAPHVLDIAAGNGQAGGPAGIAPDADLIFVHLADRNTGGLANFGDSVRLLEAVDFISRTAGSQPCVINISAGRICGPKDGTTLVERAFDELLAATPGRFVVNSAGNYFGWRTHSCGTIAPGENTVAHLRRRPRRTSPSTNSRSGTTVRTSSPSASIRPDTPGAVRCASASDLTFSSKAGSSAGCITANMTPTTAIITSSRTSTPSAPPGTGRSPSKPGGSAAADSTPGSSATTPARGCQARFTPDDSNPAHHDRHHYHQPSSADRRCLRRPRPGPAAPRLQQRRARPGTAAASPTSPRRASPCSRPGRLRSAPAATPACSYASPAPAWRHRT